MTIDDDKTKKKTWNWNENQFYSIELHATRQLTFVSNNKNRLGQTNIVVNCFSFILSFFFSFKFQIDCMTQGWADICCIYAYYICMCICLYALCVWMSAHWPCGSNMSILSLYWFLLVFIAHMNAMSFFIIHLKSIAQINRIEKHTYTT